MLHTVTKEEREWVERTAPKLTDAQWGIRQSMWPTAHSTGDWDFGFGEDKERALAAYWAERENKLERLAKSLTPEDWQQVERVSFHGSDAYRTVDQASANALLAYRDRVAKDLIHATYNDLTVFWENKVWSEVVGARAQELVKGWDFTVTKTGEGVYEVAEADGEDAGEMGCSGYYEVDE